MKSHIRTCLVTVLISVTVSGCAKLNSIYRDFDVSDGSGAMVDIKQRAVFTTNIDGRQVVCAEPSPDAISAYAAQFAAEGGNSTVGAAATAAAQESASFVGLRTQSIQLLRDALYRACEGFASGAISKGQFEILQRRYQRYMVALLGIEQLTGAVRAPTVTISAQGIAEAAKSLSVLRAERNKLEEEIEVKEKALETAKAEDKDKIQAELDELQSDKKSIESGIENARSISAGGSLEAAVSQIGMIPPRSDAAIQQITKSVEKIVVTVLGVDDLGAVCLTTISDETLMRSELGGLCQDFLKQNIELRKRDEDIRLKEANSRIDILTKLADAALASDDPVETAKKLGLERNLIPRSNLSNQSGGLTIKSLRVEE